jgi:hypothetical protein
MVLLAGSPCVLRKDEINMRFQWGKWAGSRLPALVLVFALVLALNACVLVQPLTSGINGIVMLGPLKPVTKEGEINDKPYPDAIIWVMNEQGTRKLAEVKSDAEGRFTIALVPGKYLLNPQSPKDQALPRGEPQTVEVLPDHFVGVTVNYDTGIR